MIGAGRRVVQRKVGPVTDTAPAFSAITACSALMTSMMTPPFNISARPVFRRKLVGLPLLCDMSISSWL